MKVSLGTFCIFTLGLLIATLQVAAEFTLISGENHKESIVLREIDSWTFEAEEGDYIFIRAAKADFESNLSIYLNLQPPEGGSLRIAPWGPILRPRYLKVDSIDHIAQFSGTYTAMVSDEGGRLRMPSGDYFIRLAKVPGEFVIPVDDEGGDLIPGSNQEASIDVGDLDIWTFDANEGDYLLLRMATLLEEPTESALVPGMNLLGPDGELIDAVDTYEVGEIGTVAPTTGKYYIIATDRSPVLTAAGSGEYMLRMTKFPGVMEVPEGDEGGDLVNGANHEGFIDVGDVDVWTFDAKEGDSILLRLAKVFDEKDTGLSPGLLVLDPNGSVFDPYGSLHTTELGIEAKVSGTYSVVVRDESSFFSDTGNYNLSFLKVPGLSVVQEGDEGGVLTPETIHQGVIEVGDMDLWTLSLEAGEYIFATLEELLDIDEEPFFSPKLFLLDPDGAFLVVKDGDTKVELSGYAEKSGTYSLIVSKRGNYHFPGGRYKLQVIRYKQKLLIPESVTINEEDNLNLEISLDDPLGPIQDLVFSIVSAPMGVSLSQSDEGNATLSWTPAETQGPNEFQITCAVKEYYGGFEMTGSKTMSVQVNEVNLPPEILPEIWVIEFTDTLILPVKVLDPDFPPNQFNFSLEGGPPGISIDAETGIISWAPTIFDEGTLYNIDLRVVDNGSPPLSDNETIQVYIHPMPVSMEFSKDQESLLVTGLTGYSYSLEQSTDLKYWTELENFTLKTQNLNQRLLRLDNNQERIFLRIRVLGPTGNGQ